MATTPKPATELTAADINAMSVQDLYDMGPDDVAALNPDAWETRGANLVEYLRDVDAGFEPPLRAPDAYLPGFVTDLTITQMETLLELQQSRGRAAVIKARQEMRRAQPPCLRRPDPLIYPVGMPPDSYGPTVATWDDDPR